MNKPPEHITEILKNRMRESIVYEYLNSTYNKDIAEEWLSKLKYIHNDNEIFILITPYEGWNLVVSDESEEYLKKVIKNKERV